MALSTDVMQFQLRSPTPSRAESDCIAFIAEIYNGRIETSTSKDNSDIFYSNIIGFLENASNTAAEHGDDRLSHKLHEVVQQCTTATDFGGYGLSENAELTADQEADVVFLCSAYLEALKAEARAKSAPQPLDHRPPGRRGMTMTEKIFAMHDVSRRGSVKPGDVVQVDVDWVLASELSWTNGIELSYDFLGRPGIFRNDRFWLAGDHRVEPALYEKPAVKALMQSSRKAEREFKMTDFQGFNYTIMHTEFVRERAQPGMLIIGADSHSCSAGAVSCLSIGMGATDVCMPLITGQTWFSIPETVSLKLINAPPKGVGGKDTILYILKEFKRNTIAADRIVEFSGPGLQHLSCDARFAISNMCTEFGAVTGIFESDEQTYNFVNRRSQRKHRSSSVYFKPDEDAEYAEKHVIDLSKVESFIAVYPSPDNVVPVSDVAGTKLDGCFIGACTTAEEDLLIGAMVIEAGLKRGFVPVPKGRRLVVPGSRPIQNKLERLGYLDIYRKAGFNIGVPGCSMCVGQGTDQAHSGEKWLSSQNRNFKNRMGPGSIANLGSAATVAMSSFFMEMTNPRELLDEIDMNHLREVLNRRPLDDQTYTPSAKIQYSEPFGKDGQAEDEQIQQEKTENSLQSSIHENPDEQEGVGDGSSSALAKRDSTTAQRDKIEGKALVMGDFIDTDAIIPSKFMTECTTEEELGPHCFEFFMPEFRDMVKSGLNIIVAGTGFGVGSSRDCAVPTLKGAGVKCVIARQFAFIYNRNQPNLGLLGIIIQDEEFYELAKMGESISIDMNASVVNCGGKSFPFTLSDIEKRLIEAGGMTEAFRKFGKSVFNELCRPIGGGRTGGGKDIEDTGF